MNIETGICQDWTKWMNNSNFVLFGWYICCVSQSIDITLLCEFMDYKSMLLYLRLTSWYIDSLPTRWLCRRYFTKIWYANTSVCLLVFVILGLSYWICCKLLFWKKKKSKKQAMKTFCLTLRQTSPVWY